MAVPPSLALSDGIRIPQLLFGVSGLSAAETGRAVRIALDTGYRGIDTTPGTETAVGTALATADVPREELFVSVKVPAQGYDTARRAADEALAALQLEQVDLCLLDGTKGAFPDTWRALSRLRADGRVRAVGVAGFGVAELRRLIDATGAVPAVNQVELHPWLQQLPLREFHAERGIVTAASSPAANAGLLAAETVTALAAKYGKTPAQIVLRWHLQAGTVAVAASATTTRTREQFGIFDFELADDDLTVVEELDNGTRV
ncbi:aldo/keto reductase [Amycolatopsis sp. FBCC-B4732]|uniref:aldo/keto reductase n=1 Tax=Amycolatopsis sp. FBCC-B4732 TaxID=3079339 RepID=UPI001FF6797E|nr:aldo/keto reductase [Amycolatopsis sp. FBCC-B4732]UOX91440.1 aldo/keto reductase [Amycolatopsis sp. FBCC-B4732]